MQDNLNPCAYDEFFDQIREALTNDIAYSIMLAKAANTILSRRESVSRRVN